MRFYWEICIIVILAICSVFLGDMQSMFVAKEDGKSCYHSIVNVIASLRRSEERL